MKINPIKFIAISILIVGSLSISACKKDEIAKDEEVDDIPAITEESQITDEKLFEMAKEIDGFTWFKNSAVYLEKSEGTGHSQKYMRTRYNKVAATMLDSVGRIIEGVTFPNGSLIVKELINADSIFERYAILYKNDTAAYADAKGWVWGYINADASVAFSAASKGTSCISCHSASGNIDYMLMNKYFQ